MANRIRTKRLRAKRQRQVKLRKLRAKFASTVSETEKQKILEKVGRIAPWLTAKEFTAPLVNTPSKTS
ncbi:hypothetical protein KJ596_04360 [Patescibacteria group bacterium]|nr:hypothetical protein [Patescibacteria group bacterium]MBU1868318.1 hypothetical protein [Patescibacteria group bacterium]